MDTKTVALLGGLLFLLLAIVGGGFTIREINMPRIPRWARVACLIVGALLLVPWFLTEVGSSPDDLPPAAVSRRSTPPIPGGEMVVHQDAAAYVSPHGIEVSGLVATGRHDPPTVGDRITIQFSLTNIGTSPLTFEQTFVGVRDPEDNNKDFGEENIGAVFEPGSVVNVKQSILVNAAGTWEFWPCYILGIDGEETHCPDEWRAFEVLVR